MNDKYEELSHLFNLKSKGAISDEEYESEKEKLLNSSFSNNFINEKTYYDNRNETFIQKLVTYKGRMNRLDFFILNLALFGIAFLFYFIFLFFLGYNESSGIEVQNTIFYIGLIILVVFVTGFFYYSSICLSIKRLHDMNLSGFFVFIVGLVSICTMGIGGLIWYFLISGTKGDNRFGPEKN